VIDFATVTTNFNPVNDIILAVVFFGGTFVYARSRIPQQTIQNLQELVSAYEKRIKVLEDDLRTNNKLQFTTAAALAELQGQVKVYKELPLQELADGIKEVSDSNQKILETLQATSIINAEDRDVLTNQNKHIASEVKKAMAR
jgi:di/tripeptidase